MIQKIRERLMRLKGKAEGVLSVGNAGRTIVLAYTLLVLIPTALLLYYYYQHTAKSTSDEVIRAMQGTLLQTQTNVSYRMENIERISDMLFIDPTINTAFKTNPASQTVFAQKQEQDAILRILETYSDTEEIFEIKIYVNSPKLYCHEGVNFFSFQEAQALNWFAGAQQAAGAIYWSGARTVLDSNGTSESVLTCARLLLDLDRIDRVIGAVAIEIREQVILDILKDTGFSDEVELCLVDASGQVMAGKTSHMLPVDMLAEGITQTKDGYLLVSSLENINWKLTAFVPQEHILGRDDWFNSFFGVFVLMLLFGLFMLAFFVMFGYIMLRVNRRIRRIAAKIESEGASSQIGSRTPLANDEFYDLESRIDIMVGHIQELMQRSYSAEIEKKDAELKMFQAQINPHFLYNTLNSISWTAIRTGATEVNEMIQMLSKYFRLSLSGGRDMVPVQDEISLARVYLDIQNVRFMGIISVTFDVDDDILHEQMPKLTLQPILENAVLHGLQYKEDKDWQIIVAGWRDGDSIVFRISDNGVGMTPEQLELLKASLHREDDTDASSGSFGLYNVYRRLELRYGDKNSLEIRSVYGAGTDVVVRIMRGKLGTNENKIS